LEVLGREGVGFWRVWKGLAVRVVRRRRWRRDMVMSARRERERERVKSYNLQVISRFVPGVGAVLVGTCLHAKYLGQKTGAPNGVVVHSNRSSAGTVFWLEI
jgi:hypothetical protein